MANEAGIRVLVVDDESVIASSLSAILRQSGYLAESFTNPLDALRSAMQEAPDVLISDVVMPHMSGVDLAMRVKSACPDCRVLLFSGQAATVSFLEEARSQGHNFHLLSKPIHPLDLLRVMRRQSEEPRSFAEQA